jgi:hypothetical protein
MALVAPSIAVAKNEQTIAPYLLIATGGAAIFAGALFVKSSLDANAQLESEIKSHDEYARLSSRARRDGAISVGLFATAIASIAAGLIWDYLD